MLCNTASFALSQSSFLQFSIQLERCFLHATHLQAFFSISKGDQELLAISYSHIFRKTCHFQVARTPAILVFLLSHLVILSLNLYRHLQFNDRHFVPSSVFYTQSALHSRWAHFIPANSPGFPGSLQVFH